MLRPQDLAVAAILGEGKALSYEALAEAVCLSVSEAHAAVRRLIDARLVSAERRLYAPQFLEFLAHGAKYVWPLKKGSVVMGLPTGGAAAMFSENDDFPEPQDLPLVWEAPGDPRAVRGVAVEPLYKKVPKAVAANDSLYAMLALIDAVRADNVRERSAGLIELERRLEVAS
jgi:hypothetical protein